MAILMGKQGHQPSSSQQLQPPSHQGRQHAAAAKRAPTPDKKRLSSDSNFNKQFKSTISKTHLAGRDNSGEATATAGAD